MLYGKGGGLFDTLGGMYKSFTGAVSGFVKGAGITQITTPSFQVGFNPASIPVTTTSATRGQSGVTIVAQPQLPTRMILIGGAVVVGILVLLMFMRK